MRFFLLVLVLPFLAMGCRASSRCQRETAMLIAEIVDLEDQYALLKSKHKSTVNELRTYRGEPVDSWPEDGVIVQDDFSMGEFDEEGSVYGDPVITNAYGDPVITNAYGDPVITEPDDTFDDRNAPTLAPSSTPPDNRIRSIQTPGIGVSHITNSASITRITINQRATRGHDVDGEIGDEGVDLLVQPRTESGSIELQAGELTVSIIDPSEPADRQRIGLWKFLPEETELFFANHELGSRGILLHLPWDQSTPRNPDLTIHVRFVTEDGRTLKTTGDLRITPPANDYLSDDPLIARWTQRDARWGNPPRKSIANSWQPKSNQSIDRGRGLQASAGTSSFAGSQGGAAPDRYEPGRRRIQAIPAKSTSQKPAWSPDR